jgi:hypothetical protein
LRSFVSLDSLDKLLDGMGLVPLRFELGNQSELTFFSAADHQ